MTTSNRSAHNEFEVDHEFGRQARSLGGISREAALTRAGAEIDRIRPQVADYIHQECARLETLLRAACEARQLDAASATEAYQTSQHVRDVADTVGYPLVGLIAANLCTIFEAVETAEIAYPHATIECHYHALRLALSQPYLGKKPNELPELAAGLTQIAQIVRATAPIDDSSNAA